ncbi:Putative membrane spanning protein (plasmid) [Borrelia hermsii YBT]|uniref:virulence associated lipoprotein n=1 Tax=Borrelia hermsii TaxID=140 RepID=UPI0003E353F5|nr:virulence associated lipoprotein [Borrelia hermsii]AHH13044.1 Putative membrane spanning protein [Borrelia hermsii YBT]
MKHKHIFWVPSITFIIIFILPLLTLIACNAEPGKTESSPQSLTGDSAIQALKAKLKQHKREFIIAKLKLKVTKYENLLYAHNYSWIEDGDEANRWHLHYGDGGTQYGMKGRNKVFDVILSPHYAKHTSHRARAYNNTEYSDYDLPSSKTSRKQVYLAFEYDENPIRIFGRILNKLAASAVPFDSASKSIPNPNEYNKLVQEIADKTGEYARDYFEIAFGELFKKQNNINSLSYDMLQELDQKFNKLMAEREMHIKDAKTIYNDFNADKDQIRTGDAAKLKDYLIKYRPKFENSFGAVKTLAGEIKNILDAI